MGQLWPSETESVFRVQPDLREAFRVEHRETCGTGVDPERHACATTRFTKCSTWNICLDRHVVPSGQFLAVVDSERARTPSGCGLSKSKTYGGSAARCLIYNDLFVKYLIINNLHNIHRHKNLLALSCLNSPRQSRGREGAC